MSAMLYSRLVCAGAGVTTAAPKKNLWQSSSVNAHSDLDEAVAPFGCSSLSGEPESACGAGLAGLMIDRKASEIAMRAVEKAVGVFSNRSRDARASQTTSVLTRWLSVEYPRHSHFGWSYENE
jgi:hypothetical protein